MGYSCNAIADFSETAIVGILKDAGQEIPSQNMWEKNGVEYFSEVGRENADGAVTGIVRKCVDYQGVPSCLKAGSFRVEPNGKITRWPTSTKKQRESAYVTACAKFETTFRRAYA